MPRIGRPVAALELTNEERERLEAWVRRHTTPHAVALRAKIILLCDQGLMHEEMGRRLEIHPTTLRKWRRRAAAGRFEPEPCGAKPVPTKLTVNERGEWVLPRFA